MLHIGKYLDQRQFNFTEELFHALFYDLALQICRKRRECRSVCKAAELGLIGERSVHTQPFNQIVCRRRIQQIRTNHIIQHKIMNGIMLLHEHPIDGLCVKGALWRFGR